MQKLKKLLKSFEIRNIKKIDLEHSKVKLLQLRAIFTVFQMRNGFRSGFRSAFRRRFREKQNSLKYNDFFIVLVNDTHLFHSPNISPISWDQLSNLSMCFGSERHPEGKERAQKWPNLRWIPKYVFYANFQWVKMVFHMFYRS